MSQSQMKATKLPSLEGATDWLNRSTAELRETKSLETKGHPTLVHFWSISSETSKTNLAQVAQLRDQRKREGLRVIAVHSPQSETEKDSRSVRDAIARLNLTEPCALDNDQLLRAAFAAGTDDLPVYYLFDNEGKLRSSTTGETGVDAMEDELDQLVTELRSQLPFCPSCERFLSKEAMFCPDCGLPLTLPGAGVAHPYYENQYQASLPTVRLKFGFPSSTTPAMAFLGQTPSRCKPERNRRRFRRSRES
jgi:hypothetical protein